MSPKSKSKSKLKENPKKEKSKEKEKKKVPASSPPTSPKKMRQIVIVTDGNDFRIIKADVTPLEFREICRSIIMALGGKV